MLENVFLGVETQKKPKGNPVAKLKIFETSRKNIVLRQNFAIIQ